MLTRAALKNPYAVFAICMIALGLARPTRLASCGIGIPRRCAVRENRRVADAEV